MGKSKVAGEVGVVDGEDADEDQKAEILVIINPGLECNRR
jgi:hypothetical protein